MTRSSIGDVFRRITAGNLSAAARAVLRRAGRAPAPAPLSHISFGVRSLQRSITFYDAVLGTLGHVRVWTDDKAAGYGRPGQNDYLALFERPESSPPGTGFHLAFNAESREIVDRFHAASMAAGAVDHGASGVRPHYGPKYYACFVTDLDGYKLEAVHQG